MTKKTFLIPGFLVSYALFVVFLYFFTGQPLNILTPIYFLGTYGFSSWIADVGLILSFSVGCIILFFAPDGKKIYGNAHFASHREIRQMGLYAPDGLILGRKGMKYIKTSEPLSALAFAPPGSGKTAGVIIPSLLSCSNSMIVHDPKSELFNKTSKRRRQVQKIIKFAPGEPGSMRWNPLAKAELPADWEQKQAVVDRIANSFITSGKYSASGDDYWTREARSLFSFYALYLIHVHGETSFEQVLTELLTSDDKDDETSHIEKLQSKISEIIKKSDTPKRLLIEGAGLAGKAYKEFSGMVGTCKSYLEIFLDETVAKNTAGCDFRIRDLRKEPTTIYLTVKTSDQTRLKPLFSLFFETATLQLMENEPEKDDLNITLLLDEFKRLNRMQEVLELPSISRSYRVNVIFVVQSLSQIDEIYGKAGTDQLRNTCAYHIIFAQNELRVADETSRAIGNKTRTKKSRNTGKTAPSIFSTSGNSQSKNTGESQEGVPLIRPQEIMSLPKNKIIILCQNHFETPIKADVCLWFKDRIMRKIINEK